MRSSLVRFAAASIVAFAASAAQAQEWGDLKGKIVFEGAAPKPTKVAVTKDAEALKGGELMTENLLVDKDGGVANVVVYLRTPTASIKINPDIEKSLKKTVVMDNSGLRFKPHVAALWFNKQGFEITNTDPVAHNSNVQPLGDAGANPLLPPAGNIVHQFNKKQAIPVPVQCNIHPWMSAYVLPRDNPYFAVTAPDGTFKIEKLPAGEWEFQAWHEKAGYLEAPNWPKGKFTKKIAGGANDLGTIKVPAGSFNK